MATRKNYSGRLILAIASAAVLMGFSLTLAIPPLANNIGIALMIVGLAAAAVTVWWLTA